MNASGSTHVPAPVQALLWESWQRWNANKQYLQLTPDYDVSCPPLWFIGGADVQRTATPLVVLSLEPLLSDKHFAPQRDFASLDFEHYVDWQWSYFRICAAIAIYKGFV
jgi:hypothetical protein